VPRTVHIPAAGGRSLHGRLFGPAEQRPGILLIHGLHSTQAGYGERAEALADELGAVCLTFDLGGHGESEGAQPALSLADHIGDVAVAYDRLVAERDVDPGRIGVAGASYGGYLAAVLTARRPVARLAIRAPALYADADVAVPPGARAHPHRLGDGPNAALDAVRAFTGPFLVVESGRDTVVPAEMVRAYLNAAPRARHAVMAEAEHALLEPERRAEFLALLVDFFRGL
jgi:pimeloyl-ACP methyl ester carboxylesterase